MFIVFLKDVEPLEEEREKILIVHRWKIWKRVRGYHERLKWLVHRAVIEEVKGAVAAEDIALLDEVGWRSQCNHSMGASLRTSRCSTRR